MYYFQVFYIIVLFILDMLTSKFYENKQIYLLIQFKLGYIYFVLLKLKLRNNLVL